MQKKLVIPLTLFMLFILLACFSAPSLTEEEISSREQTATALQEMVNELMEETPSSEVDAPAPPVQPTEAVKPTTVTDPTSAPVSSTSTEYSVTAQNFDCICSETGTATRELTVVGDHLHIGDEVYDKVEGNSYKRSWMGYYILVSGEGANKTETKVDELKTVIIILTDTGYILENYSGDSGSPCCIYAFTRNP